MSTRGNGHGWSAGAKRVAAPGPRDDVALDRPGTTLCTERGGKPGDQLRKQSDLSPEPLLTQPEQEGAEHRQADMQGQ